VRVPELQFKGKEFVYNHHLTVPFRPLEIHAGKGIGAPALDGNHIIHGCPAMPSTLTPPLCSSMK
jgi:adenine-specific DNA-methyltransferase